MLLIHYRITGIDIIVKIDCTIKIETWDITTICRIFQWLMKDGQVKEVNNIYKISNLMSL